MLRPSRGPRPARGGAARFSDGLATSGPFFSANLIFLSTSRQTPETHMNHALHSSLFRTARGLGLAGLLAGGTAWAGLQTPFAITAQGKPIDVEKGHAAPWVADFNGDGRPDLLVGQFGNGRLRLYRNVGTARAPKFAAFAWFQAGGKTGKVPAG
jgi:hypothetical protein